MSGMWDTIWLDIQRMAATGAEVIAPNTLENAKDFLMFACDRYATADNFGIGYDGTVCLDWSFARPMPIQIEIFDDRYEFYQFFVGKTDIRHFSHRPGEAIPKHLVDLLDRCLPD